MASEFQQRFVEVLIPNGQPADVRKIEFELLDGGSWRWRLSTPDGPIFSVVAEPHEIESTAFATEIMLHAVSYGSLPWET
ncbi:MAG: hypothetical protein AB7I37_12225 [Pirellulales bacterium]